MTTSTTTVTHQSVKNIPLDGFGVTSTFAKSERFHDETEQERNRFAEEHGIHPSRVTQCHQQYSFEERGYCTRVGGSAQHRHTGMHIAGNGDYVVGAW